MKINKIYFSDPKFLKILTQEKVEECLKELHGKFGKLLSNLIPNERDFLYQVEFFKLYYLTSALRNLNSCDGFREHINEYNNNQETTYFVTLIADILLAHNLKITLEPNIPNHMKKPDIYAEQDGFGVYFECKNPIEPNPLQLLREQQTIFESLSNIISNNYSLACFYENELTQEELVQLKALLESKLATEEDLFEDKILVESDELKVKIVVSGISDDIEKESVIAITGIPVFNAGYCYVNGINHYGKNIVFYKKASKNTILSQIKNSYNKVPKDTPYVVVINLSSPRFDIDHYIDVVTKRFIRKDDTSISGILFIQHTFENENLIVNMKCVSNPNAVVPLRWLDQFINKTISKDIFLELK